MGLNGSQRADVEERVLSALVLAPLQVLHQAGPAWGLDLFTDRRVEAAAILEHGPDLDTINQALQVAGSASVIPPPEPSALQGLAEDVRSLVDLRADKESRTGKTHLLDVAAIFAPLPPVPWLCQALDVAPGAPVLVAGYGFSGKTLAAQDLALAVATGTPAWGRFPVRAGRVLHLDYEQGSYLTRSRYQRLAAGRAIDPTELERRLLFAPMPPWYLDGDSADELARLSDGRDLVVIDSFRAACPRTDENSSDARIPLDRLTRISETSGATFLVIHHARKPSQNATGGARMSVRGSGALYDACGSVLVFGGEKGEPVTVEHEKARISGRPHEAFQLWIEDVDHAGDPRGGLRVSVLTSTPPDKQTPTQRFQELQDRVLAVVVAQGGSFRGGSNLLARAVEARKADTGDALEELMRQGRLVNAGTRQRPVFAVPTAPGTTSEEA